MKNQRIILKYTIIVGSHRKKSQSRKVADFCYKTLDELVIPLKGNKRRETIPQIELIDLGLVKLPFWSEELSLQSSQEELKSWNDTQVKLKGSKAFIFVVPEWGGMVPSAMKNFFLLDAGRFLYHRPALIISVSASRNGAYPIAELRMSSYKNTHVHYLTEHIIVKNVSDVLNDSKSLSEHVKEEEDTKHVKEDIYLRKRIKYALSVLIEYARAFEEIHKSGVLDRETYPHGM